MTTNKSTLKIAIYVQQYKKDYEKSLNLLLSCLKKYHSEIYIEKKCLVEFSKENKISSEIKTFSGYKDLDNSFDFMLTIGGDGTILRAITYIKDLNIPVLGINAGRLGFLATILQDEIPEMVEKLLKKEYFLQERSILEVVDEQNRPISELNFALNEISVVKKNTTSMITAETYLNDEYLTLYWADGLIVATPTGSTGYSLSCGGPVIVPNSGNLVLTPIAPHNLNARPLVIPDNLEISLKIHSREESYFVSFDSRLKSLSLDTKIKIRKAPFTLKIVALNGQSFYQTLRKKLLWNEDTREK